MFFHSNFRSNFCNYSSIGGDMASIGGGSGTGMASFPVAVSPTSSVGGDQYFSTYPVNISPASSVISGASRGNPRFGGSYPINMSPPSSEGNFPSFPIQLSPTSSAEEGAARRAHLHGRVDLSYSMLLGPV